MTIFYQGGKVKRLIWLSVLFALPLVAGVIERTIVLGNNDLIFKRVDDYDVVEIRGHSVLLEAGAPRVPRVMEKLVIPAGATVVGVEIIAEEWQDVPGFYKVVPAQPDVPLPVPGQEFTPQWYAPRPEIYEAAEFYPEAKVRLNGVGSMSGYRIAHVELFPVRYQPVSGVLQLATRITYRVSYRENVVSDVIATVRQRAVFGSAVAALVVNPEDVVRFAPRLGVGQVPTFLPPGDYEYVVISAPPMDTVFERLAAWKTRKGIPATVVDIAWISANYTGYDLQEKVRNFIIDAQSTWGTIYVLLGGSGDYRTSGQNIVPTRKGWYTYAGGPDGDSLPSDLYYSDLDGDWDYNGNHIYGQLSDSVDMYSDVYVGRASVYNVALAQNFVYKVMTYEKNPPTDYLKKMLLPTAILWSSYEERPMQDSIARMTPAGWVDGKLYERNGTLSRQRMIDSMNVGFGMGHWVGHGDQNGIYMGSPYLNSSDAQNLVNGDKQGIANSIGCMCGGWDLVPGGDCFAEHLVNRVGGGLVAAVMNARYGFGAYIGYYVPGPSERIDTTFYALIFEQDMFHLGAVHGLAKDAWVFYADSGMQYDWTRWCIYELNLLGDPTLPLWNDVPMNLTVNYPAAVPVGFQNVNITVTSSGSPVSNALVCLQKGDEVYARGYTNTGGTVTLSINPTSPGSMYITTTARNHYPFEDSMMVQPSNYAYITFLSCSISDPTPGGNDNGQLNPGESVELPVWVMNWGQSQGNGIVGILSADDTYATLSDTVKSFGNISASDSAYTGADGYDLDIAASCPDGHTILFTLTCSDNADSIWVSQFSLGVYACILTYQGYTVVGGNGILEPGETADIVVTLGNEGGAEAENVTATLITGSSLITINDNTGTFGSIQPGNTGNNASDPFNVTASASAAYGVTVDCDLIVQAGMHVDTLDFLLAIGEPVPSDTGFYYAYYSGGLHTYAPTFDWFEIAPPGPGTIISEITDEDADTVTVALPFTFKFYGTDYNSIGICSNGFMEMGSSTYRFGANTGIPSAGGPRAMIAPFWDDLDPSLYGDIYQYHDAANHRWIVEFYDVAHYGASGQRETFQVMLLDPMYYPTPTGDGEILVQYLNGMAQTGATFGIENYAEDVGIQYYYDGLYHEWAVEVTDSCALLYTTYPPDYVGIEEFEELVGVPVRTMLGVVYPNPFARELSISYQVASSGRVSLRVYDALGRAVCGLAQGIVEPGYYTVHWDGRDDLGRQVPAGVYFVRFDTDDYQKVEKAILLR
jgi:hypothetical protein